MYKNNYISQACGIYSRYARMVQHQKTNPCHQPYEQAKEERSVFSVVTVLVLGSWPGRPGKLKRFSGKGAHFLKYQFKELLVIQVFTEYLPSAKQYIWCFHAFSYLILIAYFSNKETNQKRRKCFTQGPTAIGEAGVQVQLPCPLYVLQVTGSRLSQYLLILKTGRKWRVGGSTPSVPQ